MRHEPTGTNLFDATQAEAMVRFMIDGIPTPESWQARAELVEKRAETLNYKYRELLWMSHAGYTHLLHFYGDDGEMQCCHSDCRIDFKREPIDSILTRIHEVNLKRGKAAMSQLEVVQRERDRLLETVCDIFNRAKNIRNQRAMSSGADIEMAEIVDTLGAAIAATPTEGMSKPLETEAVFKLEQHDHADKSFNISGPDVLLSVDYDDVDHALVDTRAEKIVDLLNKHWS
jgi:hypothetical protein